ncbi:unnamed protein product, partial [Leptidea sinapis]
AYRHFIVCLLPHLSRGVFRRAVSSDSCR